MQFRVTKRDDYQWHRRFALIPTKVAETDSQAEYVWLEWYESRLIKNRDPYYDIEHRRIGEHSGVIQTICSD